MGQWGRQAASGALACIEVKWGQDTHLGQGPPMSQGASGRTSLPYRNDEAALI